MIVLGTIFTAMARVPVPYPFWYTRKKKLDSKRQSFLWKGNMEDKYKRQWAKKNWKIEKNKCDFGIGENSEEIWG